MSTNHIGQESEGPPQGDALHDVLESFMRDGMEYESGQTAGAGPAPHNPAAPAPVPPLDSLHRLTSAEIEQLLNMDPAALDLGHPLPDIFCGVDGDELLNLDFPELMSPAGDFRPAPQQQAPPPAPPAEGIGYVADAARSVLASLSSLTASPSRGPVGEPSASADLLAPPPFAPPGYVLAGGPVFVDAATGQIVHQGGGFAMPHWAGLAAAQQQQALMPGAPMAQLYGMPMQFQPQQVQYVMQQVPAPGSPGGKMGGGYAPAPAPPPADPPSPRKPPPKRRRSSKASTTSETVAQQCAKAEQGYTFDPASGRLFRHGPALLASAKDNKELPVIKSLFETFNQHRGFAAGAPPPPGYMGQGQAPAQHQGGPTAGVCAPQLQQQGGLAPLPHHLNRSPSPLPGSPGPCASSSHLLNPDAGAAAAAAAAAAGAAALPSRRQLTPGTGHGFITSLVTRELQSSIPLPPPGASGGGGLGGGQLAGVARDKWSLFWDAYVEGPSPGQLPGALPSSILAGFRQEAIQLGKFPTRDQAARAHDLAALALHGAAAPTNAPAAAYYGALPALAGRSGEEVVAALHRDSEAALHRTSKYKGVRRLGAGQFEARAEVEDVLGGAARAAAVAATAAPGLMVAM